MTLRTAREIRVDQVCANADVFLRTRDEIRALPCNHAEAASGQLRRTPNGLRARLVCDACGLDIRELGRVSS